MTPWLRTRWYAVLLVLVWAAPAEAQPDRVSPADSAAVLLEAAETF